MDNVELRQLIIQLQADNTLLNRSSTVSSCDIYTYIYIYIYIYILDVISSLKLQNILKFSL